MSYNWGYSTTVTCNNPHYSSSNSLGLPAGNPSYSNNNIRIERPTPGSTITAPIGMLYSPGTQVSLGSLNTPIVQKLFGS